MRRETKRKAGEWLMDVSKYVFTAILISSVFKDFENKWLLYTVSAVCVILLLVIGMFVHDKYSNNQ